MGVVVECLWGERRHRWGRIPIDHGEGAGWDEVAERKAVVERHLGSGRGRSAYLLQGRPADVFVVRPLLGLPRVSRTGASVFGVGVSCNSDKGMNDNQALFLAPVFLFCKCPDSVNSLLRK